ncbi:MAG: GGDEF domain-containing protein [Spirochaetales bacterium]|nr:GGDEF domain-containing protein [Spirochaetales bacterium]
MKGSKELVAFLKEVIVLEDLEQGEYSQIAEYLTKLSFNKGATLFKQGDKGNELYIVRRGHVASSIKTAAGDEKVIAEFGAGDFFGEMSMIDDAPRSATCRVDQGTDLLRMKKEDFFKMMKSSPHIAIKVMYKMLNTTTHRLKTTSGFIAEMVRWGNEASRRAITDEVTGAYNRRYLDNAIKDCFLSSRTSRKAFSLVMMDLDYFRNINEAYTHEVGNKLLCHVVAAFKTHLRKGDILARYGGDEFTILLPETSLKEAYEIAEAIRREVESNAMKGGKKHPALHVTTSQGIAAYPENAEDLELLKNLADRALYKAKENGRNKVMTAS